jgi:FdhD protein
MAAQDVVCRNAAETITDRMALHGVSGSGSIRCTIGRLTREMVLKAARIGVPFVASRNGVTATGHQRAQRLGMTPSGRAAKGHFLCCCRFKRFDAAAGV